MFCNFVIFNVDSLVHVSPFDPHRRTTSKGFETRIQYVAWE